MDFSDFLSIRQKKNVNLSTKSPFLHFYPILISIQVHLWRGFLKCSGLRQFRWNLSRLKFVSLELALFLSEVIFTIKSFILNHRILHSFRLTFSFCPPSCLISPEDQIETVIFWNRKVSAFCSLFDGNKNDWWLSLLDPFVRFNYDYGAY